MTIPEKRRSANNKIRFTSCACFRRGLPTVEWLSQPLTFDSLALRQSLDAYKMLDKSVG
jgi:hypothetical protein